MHRSGPRGPERRVLVFLRNTSGPSGHHRGLPLGQVPPVRVHSHRGSGGDRAAKAPALLGAHPSSKAVILLRVEGEGLGQALGGDGARRAKVPGQVEGAAANGEEGIGADSSAGRSAVPVGSADHGAQGVGGIDGEVAWPGSEEGVEHRIGAGLCGGFSRPVDMRRLRVGVDPSGDPVRRHGRHDGPCVSRGVGGRRRVVTGVVGSPPSLTCRSV